MTRPDAGPYPQYIIYDRPRDFPDHFVVREWVAQGATPLPTGRVSVHPTLKDAQDAMPETYAPVSRAPEDDPVIVEVWVPEHWAETLQMVVNLGEEEAIRRLKVFSKAIPIVPTTIIRRKSDK